VEQGVNSDLNSKSTKLLPTTKLLTTTQAAALYAASGIVFAGYNTYQDCEKGRSLHRRASKPNA